jgi:phosphonate transport system substrate-binding protein
LSNDLELLDRLQGYLAQACNAPVQLVTRRTYQEITALLVSGQLDAAWICGFPFVVFEKELEIVVVPSWQGGPTYQSYVIGQKGRRFDGLADLKGDVHAFSDPDSNSGYLVTLAALIEAKLDANTIFKKRFFTFGHRNVIRAVASGLAQSGSVDGYVYDVVTELEPALTQDLAILRRSEWLGFPPIAAPARESVPGRTMVLREAFQSMAQSAEGRIVLSLLKLDGFVPMQPSLFDGIAEKVALTGLGRGR